MAAEKKDSKNGATRKYFGPSYFDPALVCASSLGNHKILLNCNNG